MSKRTDVDYADIFLELIDSLSRMTWPELKELSLEAGVSTQTLVNWAYGPTYNPQINTLVKVARALGAQIVLRRTPVKLRAVR